MPRYRRAIIPGGAFFFTVAIANRADDLLMRHVDRLQHSFQSISTRLPFETIAICILPDHLHAIWSLPENDADFSRRWGLIKSGFSRGQPRRHAIRGERDLARHIDYVHFNPVKHGLVTRVHEWPHSSFHQYVERGDLPKDWGGDMREIRGAFGE